VSQHPSDFTVRNKRVVVVGGARSGVSAARLLAARGARVALTDTRDAIDGQEALAALGVELVLGAYGPDLAGLMRYYRSAQFDLARSPLPPRKECECAFLHQAKVDATGRVTFVLDACVPGTSPDAPLALRGELTLRDDGRLVGIVSIGDVLKDMIEEMQFMITQLENYIKGLR